MISTCDVGLGTAYERLAVYRLLARWFDPARPVGTALEGPVDGMAGMPGLHLLGLARTGASVTVALSDEQAQQRVRAIYAEHGLAGQLRCVAEPAAEERHDLVLSYNALPLVEDWRGHLARLARHTRRYLLVSVTSPGSYGVWLRRGLRLLEPPGAPELFDHPATRRAVLEPELRRLGRVVGRRHLDCPWWPDLFVPTGQTLLGGTLARLRLAWLVQRGAERAVRYEPGCFPLLPGDAGHDELLARLRRHPVFDDSAPWLAAVFAHHHAYLVEIAGAAVPSSC